MHVKDMVEKIKKKQAQDTRACKVLTLCLYHAAAVLPHLHDQLHQIRAEARVSPLYGM